MLASASNQQVASPGVVAGRFEPASCVALPARSKAKASVEFRAYCTFTIRLGALPSPRDDTDISGAWVADGDDRARGDADGADGADGRGDGASTLPPQSPPLTSVALAIMGKCWNFSAIFSRERPC